MLVDQSLDFFYFQLKKISPQNLEDEEIFSQENKNSSYLIFFGLSKKIINYFNSNYSKICIYEPNLHKIKALQETLDQEIFEKIFWIFTTKDIEDLAFKFAFKNGSFFYTKNCEQNFQQFLLFIQNCKILISRQYFAIKNHKIDFERFLKNNYRISRKSVKIKKILIIGSGPSLKKHIKEIKAQQKSSFIFSSLRSAYFLIKNGVIPDFIGVLDSEEKLNISPELKAIPCFYTYQSNPNQINDFKYPIFIGNLDADPWQQFIINQFFSPSIEIEAGHTVSSFLLSIALSFSPEEVVLYGVDLSYKNGKKYFNSKDLTQENLQEIKCSSGKKFLTKQDFILSKYWFEYQSKKYPKVKFFNRSNGLLLDGFKNRIVKSKLKPKKEIVKLKKIEVLNAEKIYLVKQNLQNILDGELIEVLFLSDLQDLSILDPLDKLFNFFLSCALLKKEEKIIFYVGLIKKLLDDLQFFKIPLFSNSFGKIIEKNNLEEFFVLFGNLHGEYKRFYPNGKLLNHGFYFLNKLHGKFVSYYKNGNVSAQSFYCHGKKNGVFESFYDDGSICKSCQYLDDKKEGWFITYYSNKIIKSKIFYKDDKIEGIGILFNSDGSKKREFIAEKGVIVKDLIQCPDNSSDYGID